MGLIYKWELGPKKKLFNKNIFPYSRYHLLHIEGEKLTNFEYFYCDYFTEIRFLSSVGNKWREN